MISFQFPNLSPHISQLVFVRLNCVGCTSSCYNSLLVELHPQLALPLVPSDVKSSLSLKYLTCANLLYKKKPKSLEITVISFSARI